MNVVIAPDPAPFQVLVKDRCGLDLSGDNAVRLLAAVQARMSALDLGEALYLDRLRADAEEFQVVVNALTINETYFMRERVQLDWLVQTLVPRIVVARGAQASLRILCAGCSSGEEPYSVAMALLDARGESASRQCAVVGVDIDTGVLEKAAMGRYSAFSFRGLPDEFRDRYFDRDGVSWVVRNGVRAMVRFQAFNVLSQHIPSGLGDFDVILFRNVSIYFDAPTRKRILENLRRLLRENGVLLTGVTETLANDLGVFHLQQENGLFYFSTAAPALLNVRHLGEPLTTAAEPTPVRASAKRLPMSAVPEAGSRPLQREPVTNLSTPTLEKVRALVQARAFEPAHEQLVPLLRAQPDDVEIQILMAYVLLNRKDYVQSAALVERVLEVHSWSIDGLYLLGHIHRWQQQSTAAIASFKRAVYGCAGCWPAHYYLGGLYREAGAIELARRSFRAVQQLLATATPSGLQYVPVELPSGEMHRLCERQLASLAPPLV